MFSSFRDVAADARGGTLSQGFLYDTCVVFRFRFRICALLLVLPALAIAQQPGGSSSSQAQHSKNESGVLSADIYRNSFFGFNYKLTYGWVDRTAGMQQGDDPAKLLLLSAFERPPEATGSTINSAVVIAAEKISSFSGLKTASDYFGPITELATAKGFSVVNEPHDFVVGTKRLVRGDFAKPRSSLTMYQTSLVVLEKGYALSFTFIGGSSDEIEQLIERLSFARKPLSYGMATQLCGKIVA